MKLTRSQVSYFNQPDTLVVVSAYPLKGTTSTGGGIAMYTRRTLLGIKKSNPDQKILIIADAKEGPETYIENGILVVRVWKRNHIFLYRSIRKILSQIPKAKNLMLEFEFAAYGDIPVTSILPLFLAKMKLKKYHITLVVHQVVKSLSELSTHVGVENNVSFYNFLIKAFYISLSKVADNIITLEKPLAQLFNQITHSHKAIALPLGFVAQKALKKSFARRMLNLPQKNYYVLAFGYLSHYKGSDILVKAFKKPLIVKGKPVKLILAGGENPTQGQKPHYQHYYKKLYQNIADNPNIIHTGYLPDSRIRPYYSAADLCIFPYRTFMAASGPISSAFSFNRPIIASEKLSIYTQNTFKLNSDSIRKSIKENIVKTKKTKLHLERNISAQGKAYLSVALLSR